MMMSGKDFLKSYVLSWWQRGIQTEKMLLLAARCFRSLGQHSGKHGHLLWVMSVLMMASDWCLLSCFFQYYFIWFSMFVVVYQCHSVFDLLSYQMCSLQPDSINYQWPNMCLSYFTAGTNSHSVIQLISRWLNCCYYYEHVYLPKP